MTKRSIFTISLFRCLVCIKSTKGLKAQRVYKGEMEAMDHSWWWTRTLAAAGSSWKKHWQSVTLRRLIKGQAQSDGTNQTNAGQNQNKIHLRAGIKKHVHCPYPILFFVILCRSGSFGTKAVIHSLRKHPYMYIYSN